MEPAHYEFVIAGTGNIVTFASVKEEDIKAGTESIYGGNIVYRVWNPGRRC